MRKIELVERQLLDADELADVLAVAWEVFDLVGGLQVVAGDHHESLIRQIAKAVHQRLVDPHRKTTDDRGVVEQKLLRRVLPDAVQVVSKARSRRKQLRITAAEGS